MNNADESVLQIGS